MQQQLAAEKARNQELKLRARTLLADVRLVACSFSNLVRSVRKQGRAQ